MTAESTWHEFYKAAVLETDWTKICERIQTAESAISERRRVLALDHEGTLEERHALSEALRAMNTLRQEVAEWQNRRFRGGETSTIAAHLNGFFVRPPS